MDQTPFDLVRNKAIERDEQVIRDFLEAGANIYLENPGDASRQYVVQSVALKRAVLETNWQMSTSIYSSFFQWLPREVKEDVIALYTTSGCNNR